MTGLKTFRTGPYPWDRQDKKLIDFYRKIGSIRREHPVYADGEFDLIELNSNLLAFARTKGDETCVTIVNNTKQGITVRFGSTATPLVGNDSDGVKFEIAPFTAEIFATTPGNTIDFN